MQHNQTQQQSNPTWPRPLWLVTGLAGTLALVCGLAVVAFLLTSPRAISFLSEPFDPVNSGPQRELVFVTITPTPGIPSSTGTPTPTRTPTATSTVTSTPPGSTPVAVEPAAGWKFERVRIQPDPELGGLTIYGEAFNDSGAPQRILGLQSALYHAQGQLLTKEVIDDYWPIETVPPGGWMPFELTVLGPDQADRVELQIATEPGQPPRTDFELTEVEGHEKGSEFCVTGRTWNLGQPLDSYLMAVVILYDADDRVINWGIDYKPALDSPVGDESTLVSACAERFNNIVVRHELRVWGE